MKNSPGTPVDILVPRDTGPFTYNLPKDLAEPPPVPGTRVRVPFRSGALWGIVWRYPDTPPARDLHLRDILVVDEEPLLTSSQLELLRWAASYYLRKPGMALKTICPPGLLEGRKTRKARVPSPSIHTKAPVRPTLSPEQHSALQSILGAGKLPVLLFGVTGSGKTEVYLRAVEALPPGRGAIILVPEIALTTQTADRFLGRFGDNVVILHSGLSDGERLRGWRRLRSGDATIALGTRSAVFAPVQSVGLIVVDEEHSHTYKQEEGLRYNARDLAVVRGKIERAAVVLGSATPSLETFHNASKGRYVMATLTRRVNQRPLPDVQLVDMRASENVRGPISPVLLAAIERGIDAGSQAMILLNRRGYAPSIVCTDCGHQWKCPQCSISLTYHKRSNRLECHYCGSKSFLPAQCPVCGGTKHRPAGMGTERLEESLHEQFGRTGLRRMDMDTTRKKHSHKEIIQGMELGEISLLVGTQMLAKGHDLPRVTVAGVISADDSLNLPDFRAQERTYQLIHQFAGRAGRGDLPGEVFVQTLTPEHPVFRFILHHDYEAFCRAELKVRQELGYPPFGRLVRVVFSANLRGELDEVMAVLHRRISAIREPSVEVLGPVPCPVGRVRGRIRFHMLLKGRKREDLQRILTHLLPPDAHPKHIRVEIDVDPMQMM